eukprot:GFKZ01006239.1.p1 GENE.GFKZ01006239.1~~GFKZ01006239.1.p1  ORF type:complete len:405 (-),score=48.02 GFKZ01006239.1:623-1702(-)
MTVQTSSAPTANTPTHTNTPTPNAKPRLPQELQLVICALGIYACYLRYGLLQERIYSSTHGPHLEKFHFSSFLLLIQTSTNALIALVVLSLNLFPPAAAKEGQKPHRIRTALPEYAVVSLAYLSAMLFSFTALRFMSYPMQALGKSCKMIPVMLMGIVIRRRRYKLREFLCVGLITLGVALFSWKGKKGGDVPNSMLGFALLFGSLFMDGITGPLQERLVARHNPSTHQLMFWQNVCSMIWLGVGSVLSGEASGGIDFVVRFPSVLKDILLFSLVSALGQNFIFYTVRNFSALIVTTITTTRKMFTVLLSIFVYKHPMVQRQWLGLVLVFAAIAWEAVAKQQEKRMKAQKDGEEGKKDR